MLTQGVARLDDERCTMTVLVNIAQSETRPNRPAARLTVIEGFGRGHAWELSGPLSTIGRGSRNDIVLDFGDRTIHRDPHAAIEFDDGMFRVHDVRRGNPVLVNDEIVDEPRMVQPGDRI